MRPLPQRADLKLRKTDAETTVALCLLSVPSKGLTMDKADLLSAGWNRLTDGLVERLEAIRKDCTLEQVVVTRKELAKLIRELKAG